MAIKEVTRSHKYEIQAQGTTLSVGSTTTLDGALTIVGALSLTGAPTIVGNALITGTVGITGAVTIAGATGITGNSTVVGTLGVTGNTSVAGNLAQTAGVVSFAISAAAAATATSGTIDTTTGTARVSPAGNITGVIMEAGVVDGQVVTVVNESAFSVTMATAATSNVADGASCVIATLTAQQFVWSATPARWFKC